MWCSIGFLLDRIRIVRVLHGSRGHDEEKYTTAGTEMYWSSRRVLNPRISASLYLLSLSAIRASWPNGLPKRNLSMKQMAFTWHVDVPGWRGEKRLRIAGSDDAAESASGRNSPVTVAETGRQALTKSARILLMHFHKRFPGFDRRGCTF